MEAYPTLDQLTIFAEVADSGGFSAAARRLKRSQSVVSYAIANLEDQLQVKLFERHGTRQPRLTEAGTALLMDARRILSGLDGLRARTRALQQGLEAEIVAAVDPTVPTQALSMLLSTFEENFPTVDIRLHVGSIGVVYDQVARRIAHVGFGGEPNRGDRRVVLQPMGFASLVPVAAPSHPLAMAQTPIPRSVARQYTQIVITDVTDQTRGRDFGVIGDRTWRMTDMGLKHELMLAGHGWGGLPYAKVSRDIHDGRLILLDLEDYPIQKFALVAMHHVARPPGPATAWMIERFRTILLQVEAACKQHSDEPIVQGYRSSHGAASRDGS